MAFETGVTYCRVNGDRKLAPPVAWRKADVVGIDLVDEHHSIY